MEYSFEQIVKTSVKARVVEIPGTNFVKWYYKTTTESNGKKKKVSSCGVTHKNFFEDGIVSVDEPPVVIDVEEMYSQKGAFVAISNKDMQDVLECKKHITEVIKNINANNIDNPDYTIYIWNTMAHQLMNINMEFVPLPISISYLNASITNEYYNLDYVVKELKKSPYVINPEEVEIKKIPYYNATETSYEEVPFNVLLPLDEYKEYIKMNKILDAGIYIVKKVLKLKSKE